MNGDKETGDGDIGAVRVRSLSLNSGGDVYHGNWTSASFELGPAVLADTNAQGIASLWQAVGRHQMMVEEADIESLQSDEPQTESSEESRHFSPYDYDFRAQILISRNINIDNHPRNTESLAHDYFGCAVASSVWLENNDAFSADVLREYKCMRDAHLCNAEFVLYAKETFFRRDPRTLGKTDEGYWKAERRVELSSDRRDSNRAELDLPPLIGEELGIAKDARYYNFDVRPAVQYWLSLQGFEEEYHSDFCAWTGIEMNDLICPYLTIDFCDEDHCYVFAENKVAASGAVALYNRYLLKRKAVKLSRGSWSERHTILLKHYGVTFKKKDMCLIWCFTPVLSGEFEWAGCTMAKVCYLCLTDSMGVWDIPRLIDWINEIHCWGLTVHGPGIAEDFDVCQSIVRCWAN